MKKLPCLRVFCCVGWLAATVSGCGGVSDPFERMEVAGTVNFNGQPLPHGDIYFKGERQANQPNVAQALLKIRDGKFESNRAYKPGPGKNTVTVTVYEGAAPPALPPDDESGNTGSEPEVVGYWQTEVTLSGPEPLSFDISKADLRENPPD